MLENTNAKVVLGSGGGDIGNGAYLVKVIDYDGTIIDQKRLNANDVYTLPTAPTHDGLVFSSWSSTHTITNGTVTVENSNIMIGAVYTTASGKSEFVVELTEATDLYVTLKMSGTKDWGDGTIDTNESHFYEDYGTYKITCDGTSLTNSSGYSITGGWSGDANYYLKSAVLVGITNISGYLFMAQMSLETLILPNATSLGDNAIRRCYSLKGFVIPSGVSGRIGDYCLYECNNITDFVVPKGITHLGNNPFGKMYAIKSVVIPNTATNLGQGAFNDNYSCLEYDFRSFTSVATSGNTSYLQNINQLCKIRVPVSLYDSWKSANYWSNVNDNKNLVAG